MGALGFALILASFVYTSRKKRLGIRLFSLEQWLYAHSVLGTVSLFLIVGHSGFHLRNQVAALALLFLALVVVSGVVGLFILYFKPRSQAKNEVAVLLPDDLCRRLSNLHEEISEMCSEKGGVFLEVYNDLVIPLYRSQAGKEPPSADVDPFADRVPKDESESFMRLASRVEEVHDLLVLLGRHMRFRWWIKGWLMVHVPATIGLMVFSIVHIISMTWYGVP